MKRRLLTVLATVAALGLSRLALADEAAAAPMADAPLPGAALRSPRSTGVSVELTPCLPASLRDEILAALRVELRELATDVVAFSPEGRGDRALLSVGPGCDPSRIALRARLGSTDIVPNAERVVDIERVPDPQRPRVLAIALAELLHAAIDDPSEDAPADAARTPAALTPAEAAPAPVTLAPADEPARLRVLGGGVARARIGGGAIQVGPRIDLRIAIAPAVDAAVGCAALFAGERTPLGEVDATVAVGRAALAAALRGDLFTVDGGVFVELGRAHISATPAGDDVVARDAAGFVAATGVAAGAEVVPVKPLRARAELEGGLALAEVEASAGGLPAPGYGGAFIGLALELGVGF